MLLANGVSVNSQKFCEEHGIDFKKIVNNPVFELDSKYQTKDKANGGHTKIPARVSFPAKTFIKSPKTKETIELRYAENRNYKMVGKDRVEVFTPRYINIDTAKFSAREDDDKAVYLFARPSNVSSPFGTGKNCDYAHLDPTAIAKSRMESMSNITKALSTIENMDQLEMLILAKGVKSTFKNFNPFIDGENTHPDLVKVEFMQFAQMNADAFLGIVDSKIAKTKGQIINLVDREIIKEFSSNNTRQWKWNKGARNGNPIGDQIVDPHSDSMDYLLNYILSNLGTYMGDLIGETKTSSAEQQAKDYLKNLQDNEIVVVHGTEGLPTNFQEAKDWLGENGFRKIPAIAKKLNDAIQSGDINIGNIQEMVKDLDRQYEDDK